MDNACISDKNSSNTQMKSSYAQKKMTAYLLKIGTNDHQGTNAQQLHYVTSLGLHNKRCYTLIHVDVF